MACVFCEIVAGTAPAIRVYEDDDFLDKAIAPLTQRQ
jgi:diadenosine tetraphosphate (Ap4A) HIT family hydrolase